MYEQHFVARQRELDQLQRLLALALLGRGQVCFITGAPGAGKSTLVHEFSRRAQALQPDLLYAQGICDPATGTADPYLPFREALAMLASAEPDAQDRYAAAPENSRRLKDTLRFSLHALVEVGPDLIGLFLPGAGLAAEVGKFLVAETDLVNRFRSRLPQQTAAERIQPAELTQDQIFEQYINVLRALSERAPILLFLDDLHWADESSVNLLFRLTRRLDGSRILILATYRQEELRQGELTGGSPLEKMLPEFKRSFGEVWIDLNQAAKSNSRRFIDALLDAEPNQLNEDFRQALHHQTDGQPMFTVELLHALKESGALYQDDRGVWQASASLDWRTMPRRIEGALEKRLRRLPEAALEALKTASVEGELFTAEVVAAVQSQDARQLVRLFGGDLQQTYQVIESQDFLRIGSQRLSRYHFTHNLIRLYLLNRIDPLEQTYLHEAIGLALEQLYGEHTPEIAVQLAYHFEQAQLPEKALPYYKLAAEGAAARYANRLAVDYYSKALAVPDHEQLGKRFELLAGRERLYDLLGERDLQRADLQALQALAEQAQNPLLAARAALQAGSFAANTGEPAAALLQAQAAVGVLESDQPSPSSLPILVDGYDLWGWVLWTQGEIERAEQKLQTGLALASQQGYRLGEIKLLERLGVLAWSQGSYTQARERLDQALMAARQADQPHRILSILNNLGIVCKDRGQYAEASQIYQEALAIAHQIGDRMGESKILINLGDVYLTLGDYARSIRCAEQALPLAREIGNRAGEGISHLNLGDSYYQTGAYELAKTHGEQALGILRQTGFRFGEGIALSNLAQVFTAMQDGQNAVDFAGQAFAIASEVGDKMGQGLALNCLGAARSLTGDFTGAEGAYRHAVALWQELDDLAHLLEAKTGLASALFSSPGSQPAALSAEISRQIITDLETITDDDVLDQTPTSVFLASARELRKIDPARSRRILATGRLALQRRAARISDPDVRSDFLKDVPAHRQILSSLSG